jgi:hypothetical protein
VSKATNGNLPISSSGVPSAAIVSGELHVKKTCDGRVSDKKRQMFSKEERQDIATATQYSTELFFNSPKSNGFSDHANVPEVG